MSEGQTSSRVAAEAREAGEVSQAALREAADSVFRYVARTAERVPDGVRWRTLSYHNEPQYAVSIFNGAGGIPLFLADYFRATGAEEALELAAGGAAWAAHPSRRPLTDDGMPDRSLCYGVAGLALGWLRLHEVTGQAEQLERAAALGAELRGVPLGAVTDFLAGEAGVGIFLLRLHAASRDGTWLEEAQRRAEWLDVHARRDELGCHWGYKIGDEKVRSYLGFAHGITGIGHFLLALHEATGERRWRQVAREVAETVDGAAVEGEGPLEEGGEWRGVNWRWALGAPQPPRLCQWCHGAAGVGLFLTKAAAVLDEPRFLQRALAAGETTYLAGDTRHNASQCHGLAGNGELLVELYRLTRDAVWLARARDFARRCTAYRLSGPESAEGDVWQADEAPHASPDYLCGASGTGHFFLRVLDPLAVRMPLL